MPDHSFTAVAHLFVDIVGKRSGHYMDPSCGTIKCR